MCKRVFSALLNFRVTIAVSYGWQGELLTEPVVKAVAKKVGKTPAQARSQKGALLCSA